MKLTDIPIKEIVVLGTVMATLASFYYSTGYRLEALEAYAEDVDANSAQLHEVREQSISVNARLQRIDEKLDEVKQKIENVEEMVKERRK